MPCKSESKDGSEERGGSRLGAFKLKSSFDTLKSVFFPLKNFSDRCTSSSRLFMFRDIIGLD